ncbi:MAG: hypothetical protein AAF437_11615 [Pseudomonadota bacterium]
MATDNLFILHLGALREDVSRIADGMAALSAEMRATRQHVAGLAALQDHDHVELAQIKMRLNRLERGLKGVS